MGEREKRAVPFQWKHECAFCFSFFLQTHCQGSMVVIWIVFVWCTSLCWEWPDETPPSYSKELFALCVQNHIFFTNWSRFLLFFSTWQPFGVRRAVGPSAGPWSALCILCGSGNYALTSPALLLAAEKAKASRLGICTPGGSGSTWGSSTAIRRPARRSDSFRWLPEEENLQCPRWTGGGIYWSSPEDSLGPWFRKQGLVSTTSKEYVMYFFWSLDCFAEETPGGFLLRRYQQDKNAIWVWAL